MRDESTGELLDITMEGQDYWEVNFPSGMVGNKGELNTDVRAAPMVTRVSQSRDKYDCFVSTPHRVELGNWR